MNKGNLILVATPIGNLKDITIRAIETLGEVDLILCEDTRKSGKLLAEYKIITPKESFHDFNKEKKTPRIIEKLKNGQRIALISDSGTPGISDPGFYLVREALRQQVEVSALPGPSAFIMALTISGAPTDRFIFEGFLPRKSGKRKNKLQQLKAEKRTVIFYESPHRITQMLEEVRDYLGNRNICLVRELTKLHEEVVRGEVVEVLERIIANQLVVKGEFVVIVEGEK
ncbi:MAG: 16S rRNA (cytidine(1402)-2'-O)-methyltransferase [Candidatus Saelkia tenebricola]|nr:16S rRNA (cytidine(1402)-2'-O)-methyltransferase [Candidatus Saelkia tenebricola]